MQRIEACCLASHIGATAQTGALQCVCDLNTRTILQCSGMLKTARGPQNPVGLTCWQAFAPGSEGPCFGCPVSELAGAAGKSVEREQPDPDTGRHYLRTDSLIPLEDGRSLHLIHSLDITDVSETRRQLQHDMLLIDLLTNLSLTFASSDSFDQKVNRALSTTGRFLGVDRTYILKDYPEKCHYLRSNIWLNPDVPQNDDLDAGKFDYIVRYDGNNADYVSLASQVPVCFADLAGLPASMRSRWEGYDIISLMAIPLHADGRYWGVLSFDMCTGPRRWSDSDLRLGQAVGGILSAAIEHNRVEAGLHTVRTTLDAVLNAVPDMIYWMDDQYTILGCNRRYADHLARLPKDIAGKTDFDLYPTAAAQALRREDALVFETREPFFSEERSVPTRDGRTLWLTAGKFPVFDAAGKAVLLLCVLRDVSELKKRKESELEHLHRDEGLQSVIRTVESAGRAKIEFLSRMSHEVWKPINDIIDASALAAGALAEDGGSLP
ncbi:MAG: PAS domain-containing protein, partial [Oscillospiraceae bacterium]|nr:PAS domain-containing protein [Oscillospiraceae bacterium]